MFVDREAEVDPLSMEYLFIFSLVVSHRHIMSLLT